MAIGSMGVNAGPVRSERYPFGGHRPGPPGLPGLRCPCVTSLAQASSTTDSAENAAAEGPWYRQVTRDQWRAFWAVFLGWIVDSFDFNILTFIVLDIQKSFTVDNALAGALGTVTLVMRLAGGTIAGTAADKWGRKGPLMVSVLWFSLFAALSG